VGIALLGLGLASIQRPTLHLGELLAAWLAPALFLSGVALSSTLRARQVSFGVIMALVVWFIMALFGGFFQPSSSPLPFPLNLVQPFLWPLNLFAAPDSFPLSTDYWLNRAFISLAGVGLLLLAQRQLREAEQVLLGAGRRGAAAPAAQAVPLLRLGQSVAAVAVQLVPLRQILGMARAEFLMHQRRRAAKVITLTAALVMVVIAVLAGDTFTNLPGLPSPQSLSPELRAITYGNLLVASSAALMMTLMLFILPVVFADSAPYDQQQRVDELLASLPLPPWTYLLGKLLGFWAVALWSLGLGVLATLFIWWLKIGQLYNPLPYLEMVFVGGGLIVLLSGSAALLIGATQPNQRRAVLLVIACFVVGGIFSARLSDAEWLASLVSPLRYPIMLHYLLNSFEPLYEMRAPDFLLSFQVIQVTVLGGLLQLGLLFGLVTLWRRRAR